MDRGVLIGALLIAASSIAAVWLLESAKDDDPPEECIEHRADADPRPAAVDGVGARKSAPLPPCS